MRKYALIFTLLFALAFLSGCANVSTNDSNAVKDEDTYVNIDDPEDAKEYEQLTGYWKATDQTLPTGTKSNIELEFEEDKTFRLLLFYVDNEGNQISDNPDETYRGLYDLSLDSNEITFDINIVEEGDIIYTGEDVKNEVENIPEIASCEYTLTADTLNLKSDVVDLNFTKSYDF